MSEREEEVYSARLPAGRCTYFFDIRETAEGDRYLAITESKGMGNDEFVRQRVIVVPEDALAFNEEIGKALRWIFKDAGLGGRSEYSAQAKEAVNAGEWTVEEESTLRREYLRVGSRPAIDELAALLHKKPSEVKAKLKEMVLL